MFVEAVGRGAWRMGGWGGGWKEREGTCLFATALMNCGCGITDQRTNLTGL